MSFPNFRLKSLPNRFRQAALQPPPLPPIGGQLEAPPDPEPLELGPSPINYQDLLQPEGIPQSPNPPLLTVEERARNAQRAAETVMRLGFAGQSRNGQRFPVSEINSAILTDGQVTKPPRWPEPTRGRPLQVQTPAPVQAAPSANGLPQQPVPPPPSSLPPIPGVSPDLSKQLNLTSTPFSAVSSLLQPETLPPANIQFGQPNVIADISEAAGLTGNVGQPTVSPAALLPDETDKVQSEEVYHNPIEEYRRMRALKDVLANQTSVEINREQALNPDKRRIAIIKTLAGKEFGPEFQQSKGNIPTFEDLEKDGKIEREIKKYDELYAARNNGQHLFDLVKPDPATGKYKGLNETEDKEAIKSYTSSLGIHVPVPNEEVERLKGRVKELRGIREAEAQKIEGEKSLAPYSSTLLSPFEGEKKTSSVSGAKAREFLHGTEQGVEDALLISALKRNLTSDENADQADNTLSGTLLNAIGEPALRDIPVEGNRTPEEEEGLQQSLKSVNQFGNVTGGLLTMLAVGSGLKPSPIASSKPGIALVTQSYSKRLRELQDPKSVEGQQLLKDYRNAGSSFGLSDEGSDLFAKIISPLAEATKTAGVLKLLPVAEKAIETVTSPAIKALNNIKVLDRNPALLAAVQSVIRGSEGVISMPASNFALTTLMGGEYSNDQAFFDAITSWMMKFGGRALQSIAGGKKGVARGVSELLTPESAHPEDSLRVTPELQPFADIEQLTPSLTQNDTISSLAKPTDPEGTVSTVAPPTGLDGTVSTAAAPIIKGKAPVFRPNLTGPVDLDLPTRDQVKAMSSDDLLIQREKLLEKPKTPERDKAFEFIFHQARKLWRESLPSEQQTDIDLKSVPAYKSVKNQFVQMLEQNAPYEDILKAITDHSELTDIANQLQQHSELYGNIDRGQRLIETAKLPEEGYQAKLQELQEQAKNEAITPEQRSQLPEGKTQTERDIASLESIRKGLAPKVPVNIDPGLVKFDDSDKINITDKLSPEGDQNGTIPTINRSGSQKGTRSESSQLDDTRASESGLEVPPDTSSISASEPSRPGIEPGSKPPITPEPGVVTPAVGVKIDDNNVVGTSGTPEAIGVRRVDVKIGDDGINVPVPSTYTDNEAHIEGLERLINTSFLSGERREQGLEGAHQQILEAVGNRVPIIAQMNGKDVALRPFIDSQGKLNLRVETREPGKSWQPMSTDNSYGADYNKAAERFATNYGNDPRVTIKDPLMQSKIEETNINKSLVPEVPPNKTTSTEPEFKSQTIGIEKLIDFFRDALLPPKERRVVEGLARSAQVSGKVEINERDLINLPRNKTKPEDIAAFRSIAEKLGFLEPTPRESGAKMLQASENAGPTPDRTGKPSVTLGTILGGFGDLSNASAAIKQRYENAVTNFHDFTTGIHNLFTNLGDGIGNLFQGIQDITTRAAGGIDAVLERELPKYGFSGDKASKVTDAFYVRNTEVADGFQKAHDLIQEQRLRLPKEFLNDEKVTRSGILKTGSDKVISSMMFNAMQAIDRIFPDGQIQFNNKGIVWDRIKIGENENPDDAIEKMLKRNLKEKNNKILEHFPDPKQPPQATDFNIDPMEDGSTRVYLKFASDTGKDIVAQALTGNKNTKWNDLEIAGLGGTVKHNQDILDMLRNASETRIATAKAQGITPIPGYMHHYAIDHFDISKGFKRKNLMEIEAGPRHIRTGQLFRTGQVDTDFFRAQEKMLQEFAQESAHNKFAETVLQHLASETVPEGQDTSQYDDLLENKSKFGKNLVRASDEMLESWGLNSENIKDLKAGGHALQGKGIFLPKVALEMLRGGVGEKGSVSRYIDRISDEGGAGGRLLDFAYAALHDFTDMSTAAKLVLFKSGTLDALTSFGLLHPAKILEDLTTAAQRKYRGETNVLADVKQDLLSYGRAIPREAGNVLNKFRGGFDTNKSIPEYLRNAVLPDSAYFGNDQGRTALGKILLPKAAKWAAVKGYFDGMGKRLVADSIIQADADRYISDLRARNKGAADQPDYSMMREHFLNNPPPETVANMRRIGGEYSFGGDGMNPNLQALGSSAVVKNFIGAFPKFFFKVSSFANQRMNPLNARTVRAATLETNPDNIKLGDRELIPDSKLETEAKKRSLEWDKIEKKNRTKALMKESRDAFKASRGEYQDIAEKHKQIYIDQSKRHSEERAAAKKAGDKQAIKDLAIKQKKEYLALGPAAKAERDNFVADNLARRKALNQKVQDINKEVVKDYSEQILTQMKSDRELFETKRKQDIAKINKNEMDKAISRLITGGAFWAAYGLNNLLNIGAKGVQHREDKAKPDPWKLFSEFTFKLADKDGKERELKLGGASPLTEMTARAQLAESYIKSGANALGAGFDTKNDIDTADFVNTQIGKGPLLDLAADTFENYQNPLNKTKTAGQVGVDALTGAVPGMSYANMLRKFTDESARKTSDSVSSVENKLPGFSNKLEPKYDTQTGQVQKSTGGSALGNIQLFPEDESLYGMLGNKALSFAASAISPLDVNTIDKQEKESIGGPGDTAAKVTSDDVSKIALKNRTNIYGDEAKKIADLINQQLAPKQAIKYQLERAITSPEVRPPEISVPANWQALRKAYQTTSAEGKVNVLKAAAKAGGYDKDTVSFEVLNRYLRENKRPAELEPKVASESKTTFNTEVAADSIAAIDKMLKSTEFGNLKANRETRLGGKSEQEIAKDALTKLYNKFRNTKDRPDESGIRREAIKTLSAEDQKQIDTASQQIIQAIIKAREDK